MLNGGCVQRLTDTGQVGLPLVPVVARNPHFDQLVTLEIDVDLFQHCIGEAFVAHHDDGFEAVRAGFQGLALRRGEFDDHGRLTKHRILGNGA
jgi:hypothetical protein